MICKDCADAGDENKWANGWASEDSLLPAIPAGYAPTIKALHSKCKGDCDCQHRVGVYVAV